MPETIFTSLPQYLLTSLVLVVAQVIYVLFGFGSGLTAVGSLALLFPEIKDVVVLLLLVNLPAEVLVAWGTRHALRWRSLLGLGAGVVVGIPIGARLLSRGDPAIVLTALGWFLVGVGLIFLRLPRGGRVQPPAWAAPPTGLASGLLTGLFGTGGPPVIIWYHLSAADKTAFRGHLMTIFLLMTVVRVPSYVATGLVTAPRLWSGLAVLPATLLGAWLGHRLHVRIGERLFQVLVCVLLVLLGAMLLLKPHPH
ncbi:MAG: sulfite exporter TauE/SafE family protein [bacterium]|nr:sulfite exporter TauE/SafE family protein [bacterium]